MAPKPFNPPRPQASRGRPKGSSVSNGAKRKSIAIAATGSGSGVEKVRKNKKVDKGKGKEKEIERTSAVSARSLLPSLSPDSDLEPEPNPPEEGLEEDVSDDPFSSQPLRPRANTTHKPNLNQPSPSFPTQDNNDDRIERKETIPEDLLNVLIHQFFKEQGTRMSKDANKAVGRYMETFVREALARAAWAREEGRGGVGEIGVTGGGDLEVEDLERLAPQLVLDF